MTFVAPLASERGGRAALRAALVAGVALGVLAGVTGSAEAASRWGFAGPYGWYGSPGRARPPAQNRAPEEGTRQARKGRAETGCGVRRNAERPAADRRFDRHPESHAVQQWRAGRAGAGLDRGAGPSDPHGRLQRHREGPLSPLQPLQQRADAVHAAHHVVGRGAARGSAAGLSGLARLHPHVAATSPASCGPSPSLACAWSFRAAELAPVEFEHAKLFAPKLKPASPKWR